MKSLAYLLPTFYLFLSTPSFAQLNLEWAFGIGSKESDFSGNIKENDQGNIFMLEEIRDTADIDPGPGQVIITPQSSSALTLMEFSKTGEYLQSSSFYSAGQIGGSLLESKDGNALLLVYFTDSLVEIHNGEHISVTQASGENACFLTIGPDGLPVSHYTFPAPHSFYLSDYIIQSNGNILIGGSFQDTFSFSGPQATTAVTSRGGYDIFIALLKPDYDVLWMKTFGSENDESLEDLFQKDEQAIYFAITHTTDLLIPTADGVKTFPSNGEDNGIFGSLSMDGVVQHAYGLGGALGDQIRQIVADENNNIYICGYFNGEVNFAQPNSIPVILTTWVDEDGFVAKYTAEGDLVWTRVFRDTEYGGVYTLNLERGNELYLSGSFTSRADLDPGPDSIIVETDHRSDIFAGKLTTDGDLKWIHHFPGNEYEGIFNVEFTSDDMILYSGFFDDTLDCDYTLDENLLISNGGSDVFLMAFSEEGIINGVQEANSFQSLIYPDPTEGHVQITSALPIDQLMVFALDGRYIQVPYTIEGKEATLDLYGHPSGVYFLRIQSGNAISISKIVKN